MQLRRARCRFALHMARRSASASSFGGARSVRSSMRLCICMPPSCGRRQLSLVVAARQRRRDALDDDADDDDDDDDDDDVLMRSALSSPIAAMLDDDDDDDMRLAVASPLRDININNNNINVIDDNFVGQPDRSRRRLGVGTDRRSCEERVGDMTRQTAILHPPGCRR